MKLVIQRVKDATVTVKGLSIGHIDHGLLCYVGITHSDTLDIIDKVANKILKLRIFDDLQGIMNLNVKQVEGSILLVSQFTLYGNTKGSNRPSWIDAAKPEQAKPIFDALVNTLKKEIHTETGQFGEHMNVQYDNDGPVTILVEMEG